MTAPIFTTGQTIKLTEELEIPLANGYIEVLPVGTEVTVTEAFPDADRWEEYGVVNLDIEYAEDVQIQNPYDLSGQNDWEVFAQGVMNIDYTPNTDS